MKSNFKKIILGLCVAATLSSIFPINAQAALTRRLYGDVNGDGVISRADAEMTLEAAVGAVTLDKYQTIAADVNADGKVTTLDSLLIQRFLIGAITEFAPGECFYY